MNTIRLLVRESNGRRFLYLLFEYDKNLVNQLQKLGCSLHFSGSTKYMRIKLERAVELIRILKGLNMSLDVTALPGALIQHAEMGEENTMALADFHAFLRGQRYSRTTVKAYYFWMLEFMYFNKNRELSDFSVDDIHRFNSQFVLKRNYSVSSQRQFIGAAKLFFSFIVKCEIVPEEMQRPKREKKLPIVLSKEEIRQILRNTTNVKHKAILSLIYSSGLRISELLNLRLMDIDKNRMLIHIRLAKGKKDRYVPLSKACLLILRAYYLKYRPAILLFEGHHGKSYSPTSIRKILAKACKLSGIQKIVTPHTLRHSYATHMLEMGVDIRYIQTLLGHSRPETTMIYTHVRSQKMEDLINPLDELVKEDLSQSDIQHKFPGKSSLIPPNSWGF